jgi:mono/diheme cytochrome c family protein
VTDHRHGWTFRRWHVVTALVVIVVLAAAIGVVSQRSEIDDLTSKSDTLAAAKTRAVRQRNTAQHDRDTAQQDLDAAQQERARVAQTTAAEAAARRIEAQRLPDAPGATLFAANCAPCHGSDGGGIGISPQLSGGAVARRYSEAEEVAKVTNGGTSGYMPAFGRVLSPAQIQQVVAYTWTR